MNNENENGNCKTNFNPGERTDGISLAEAAEDVNVLIKRYPDASYLGEGPYRLHQLEFILMYTEDFSYDFIEQLACCDPPLTLTTIDILRCMALLIDEDFALQFWGREFTFKEVQEAVVEHFFNKIVPEYKTTEQLEDELEKSRAQFNTELDFLKREREDMQDLYNNWISGLEKRNNELLAVNKQSAEMDKKLAVTEKENEIQKLNQELEACKKERDEALKKLESNKKAEIDNKLLYMTQAESRARPSTPFASLRQRISDNKKTDALINALQNKTYSSEQLDVIVDAILRGLSLKGLERLCNADCPPENFQMMENLLISAEALKEG